MTSEEAIETAKCMKESLDTGKTIEPQRQSILMEDESISMIDTIFDLEQENKQLKEQLTEKNIRIKELQKDNRELRKGLNKSGLDYFINSANSIRKQVCDKIKGQILAHLEVSSEEWVWQSDNYVGLSLLKQILDQIEKGE